VRADIFERIEPLLDDDYHLSDTYAAQFQSAFRAGWDDPAMDDYNHYDEKRQTPCQSDEATSS
jgi:hypothetical protein